MGQLGHLGGVGAQPLDDGWREVGAQYASRPGARRLSSSPLPTPISSTRRGRRSLIRATVVSRHSRMSSSGIGVPS
ncbi:hypothetical protein [Phytohabitans suffuscus]|nr:hypothetical protein [Phytohabitans suffuscus]